MNIELYNLEIHLVDNCNLNCAGCSHFSPLAEKNELTPNEFENNLSSISPSILKEFPYVRLMGGEPLLNKHITKLIPIARKYFFDSCIDIVTNGILLRKMPDEFFESCIDNNVCIKITHYHIPELNNIIEEILEKYNNINICWFGNPDLTKQKDFYHFRITTNKTNYIESFNNCPITTSWHCAQLVGTKLYYCNIGAYIKYFNKTFETNIVDNEYLDLSKINSVEEIENWYKQPKQICGYCNFKSDITDIIKWQKSKRSISEWT